MRSIFNIDSYLNAALDSAFVSTNITTSTIQKNSLSYLKEDDDNFYYQIAMPGFKENEIKVVLSIDDCLGNFLIVRAEQKANSKDKFSTNNKVEHKIQALVSIRRINMLAEYRQGILLITLPKLKTSTIPIELSIPLTCK